MILKLKCLHYQNKLAILTLTNPKKVLIEKKTCHIFVYRKFPILTSLKLQDKFGLYLIILTPVQPPVGFLCPTYPQPGDIQALIIQNGSVAESAALLEVLAHSVAATECAVEGVAVDDRAGGDLLAVVGPVEGGAVAGQMAHVTGQLDQIARGVLLLVGVDFGNACVRKWQV